MKKLLAILLTLVMALSLTTIAWAEEESVAKIGEKSYTSLSEAMSVANGTEGKNSVVVEIIKSGEYEPFSISRDNVTVQAAEDVTATFNISAK